MRSNPTHHSGPPYSGSRGDEFGGNGFDTRLASTDTRAPILATSGVAQVPAASGGLARFTRGWRRDIAADATVTGMGARAAPCLCLLLSRRG